MTPRAEAASRRVRVAALLLIAGLVAGPVRLFAWALAAVFLLETFAFTWSRGEELWWLSGPVSLVIALLALVVAGSGGAWPRLHRPPATLHPH